MWDTQNRTPFRTAGYFVRDRLGAEHWTVVMRGRFRARDDGLVDLVDQVDPVMAPVYRDDSASELVAESDLSPFRPHADITFGGIACAPGGNSVKTCMVTVTVGHLKKTARIAGKRILSIGRGHRASLDGPEPFRGMRLSWRASLGGLDPLAEGPDHERRHPANFVGRGWTRRWLDLPVGSEIVLPSIEDPQAAVALGTPLPEPFGFGPLHRAWQPRLREAGTYDEAWRAEVAPLPPHDFSDAFHQAAPADQVYERLRGGEPVSIEGLNAAGPYSFRLPQIIAEATTKIGREKIDHRLRLVGAMIDGTAKTVDLVWNGAIACNGRDHMVEKSTVSIVQMAGVS